jgi:Mg-chelatase subunit ChlD
MRRIVSMVALVSAFALTGCQSRPSASKAVAPAAVDPVALSTAAAAAPTATPTEASSPADHGGGAAAAKSESEGRPTAAPVAAGRAAAKGDAAEWSARKPSVAAAPAPEQAAPGPVRAGEWDDNANYREFQRFLTTASAQPIHRVDVSNRHFIVVRDADGHAVPRCNVTITDDNAHAVTLATTASGRALLFPRAEGFFGRTATATASCEDGRAMARFSLDQADSVVDLKLDTRRALPKQKTVELAFVLDTTGSMSEEIAAVKATIQKVAAALAQKDVTLRIGLVEYKDRTDPFTTRVYPMTTDVAHFRNDVAQLSAAGGGDYPEAMNEGLHAGLTRLEWSGDAVIKLAFLVGDAPPHLDYQEDADYAQEMRSAAHRGIHVYTVAASGMDALGQAVWRQIAMYTGATNLFVLRGGAGPQSKGGGDPISSCGGTQTAYASGNLGELIVKKVEGELRAIDGDPLRIPGVGVDENAKPCNERLVMAQ